MIYANDDIKELLLCLFQKGRQEKQIAIVFSVFPKTREEYIVKIQLRKNHAEFFEGTELPRRYWLRMRK